MVRREGTAPGSAGSSFTPWMAKGSSCAPTRRPASPTVSPWTTGRRVWSRSTSKAPSPGRRSSRSGRPSRPLRLRREQRQHRQSQPVAHGLPEQAAAGGRELVGRQPATEEIERPLDDPFDLGPLFLREAANGAAEHAVVDGGQVILHLLRIAGEAGYALRPVVPVSKRRGEGLGE